MELGEFLNNAIYQKKQKELANVRIYRQVLRWPTIGTAHAGIYVRMLLCAVSTDKRKGKRHRRRNGFPWKLTNAARFLKTDRFLIANPVSVTKSFFSFFFFSYFLFFLFTKLFSLRRFGHNTLIVQFTRKIYKSIDNFNRICLSLINDVDKFYDHNGWGIEEFAVTRSG